jgi:hypothetical protein
MKSNEIVISKKTVYTIAVVVAILTALVVFGGKFSILGVGQASDVDATKLIAGSPEKFAVLSSHGTQGSVGST